MRENDLLRHIYARSSDAPPGVVLGPGDDMAMVRVGGCDLLAAVDQVVADRHFREATAPAMVGRKAVARSLSDVAAMAALPLAALAAATLPPDYRSERARELFDGMRAAADAHGCPLIGGDIAFHADAGAPLVCSVTILARPGSRGPVLRRGAQPGDTIYVTGALGGAVAEDGAGGRHLTFTPRIDEARALHRALGPRLHAMIDVSDGLGRDAANLAVASGIDIEIDAARIPCRPGLGWKQAASEGEDYELLFAAAGTVPVSLGGTLAVTAVGCVAERRENGTVRDGGGHAGGPAGGQGGAAVRFRDESGRLIPGDDLGWQHES